MLLKLCTVKASFFLYVPVRCNVKKIYILTLPWPFSSHFYVGTSQEKTKVRCTVIIVQYKLEDFFPV
jgi:hypothetical protein